MILSLDWVDLAGTLRTAHAGKPVTAKIIQVSVDQYVHNGWSMDYQGLPPVDVYLLAEPDAAVPALLAAVKELRPNPPPLPEPGVVRAHRRCRRSKPRRSSRCRTSRRRCMRCSAMPRRR